MSFFFKVCGYDDPSSKKKNQIHVVIVLTSHIGISGNEKADT